MEIIAKIEVYHEHGDAAYYIDKNKDVIYVVDHYNGDRHVDNDYFSNALALIEDYREGFLSGWSKALAAYVCPEWFTEEDLSDPDVVHYLNLPQWFDWVEKYQPNALAVR